MKPTPPVPLNLNLNPRCLRPYRIRPQAPTKSHSLDRLTAQKWRQTQILCPEDVSDQPQPIPADSDCPDVEPEVEPANVCVDPCPELPETSTGSRSLIPLPRRGIWSRKQPERYTPIRRLQVLLDTQAHNGSSVWLFPIICIAVTLTRSLPSLL